MPNKLVWDEAGKRFFETGVSKGILFVQGSDGSYGEGVAWNGLTAVNHSPEGGELTDFWADNIKYASIRSAENFKGSIEAYTYPDEFAECDGSKEATNGGTGVPGMYYGQQARKNFGFVYRSSIGSDTQDPSDANAPYKLHIIYNASVNPSERAYSTINDSPEAATLSWDFDTTGVIVEGFKPVAHIEIDSRKFTDAKAAYLTILIEILEGSSTAASRLPTPIEIAKILATGTTA